MGVGVFTWVETAASFSKRVILRPIGSYHADPCAAKMETLIAKGLNDLGIGPRAPTRSPSPRPANAIQAQSVPFTYAPSSSAK